MELCKCGHGYEDHDHDDPAFPDSTACQQDFCDCDRFEPDEEAAEEEQFDRSETVGP